jgi:hypothetical protein
MFRKCGTTGGHIWEISNTGGHISEMWQNRGTYLGNVAIQGDTIGKCCNTRGHISATWHYRETHFGNTEYRQSRQAEDSDVPAFKLDREISYC